MEKEVSVFLEENYVSYMNVSKSSVSPILDYLRVPTEKRVPKLEKLLLSTDSMKNEFPKVVTDS